MRYFSIAFVENDTPLISNYRLIEDCRLTLSLYSVMLIILMFFEICGYTMCKLCLKKHVLHEFDLETAFVSFI